jgi:hypothetical protein
MRRSVLPPVAMESRRVTYPGYFEERPGSSYRTPAAVARLLGSSRSRPAVGPSITYDALRALTLSVSPWASCSGDTTMSSSPR